MTQKLPQQTDKIKRRLNLVRWVAIPDLILLIALVTASRLGNRELVSVLGPIHGINYLFLVMVVSLGAVDKVWKWWFPVLTFFTGGPMGSFIGEVVISKQLERTGEVQ